MWRGMCGWMAGGGKSGWLLGLKGDADGPYICILASQAADMRASLRTYIISGPVCGPTHPHSHTALHTHPVSPFLLSTVSPCCSNCYCIRNPNNSHSISLRCQYLCLLSRIHPSSLPDIFIRFSADFPPRRQTRGTLICSESFRSQTRETRVVTDQPQPRDPQC